MAQVGVQITTSVLTGSSTSGVATGRFHVAGFTERGPVGSARIVRSRAQFEAVYGGRTPYNSALYDTARLYWEEGGDELAVSRTVGAGATTGTLILKDTADVDTLTITAVDPGAASTRITIEVLTGANSTYTLIVRVDGKIVSRAVGLATPGDAVNAFTGHSHVRVTNIGSVTVAPGNNPKSVAATAMSAGTDDRASVTAASFIAALVAAGPELGGSAVAVPGQPSDTVGPLLLEHAKAFEKVALLSLTQGTEVEEALSYSLDTLRPNGDFGALVFPHMVIPDGSANRVVSPEGYAAAVRNRAHATTGFWQAPPGTRSLTRWALGTEFPVNVAENDLLNEYGINGIVTIAGKPRLYGWASLSADRENLGLLSNRDTLNTLSNQIRAGLEPFVFETIDAKGILLGRIESAVVGVLAPVAAANGFFALVDEEGDELDPGYSVSVDSVINTETSLASNEVNVRVAVRLAPMASLINVEIIKVPLSAAI